MTELFVQARQLFREGDQLTATGATDAARQKYLAGALRLERIPRDGGVRNGALYYNIGNCYFRASDLGRAILNYRRAERFTPNDANLRQNLAFARAQRPDVIPDRVSGRVAKTVLFLHYDLSPLPKMVLAALFLNAGATLGLLRLARRRVPRWAVLTPFVAGTLFLASLAWWELNFHGNPPGVLVAESVTARKGDGDAYEPSFTAPLHAGTEFRLVERRVDWYHVELSDGRTCWIPQTSAELVTETPNARTR